MAKAIDPTANVTALVLREVESLRREAKMRESFAHQLRKAESKRINANLAAIIATAQRAVDTQVETAKTLAATVDSTRTALEASQDAKLKPLNEDVAQLKAAFYQGAGARASRLDLRTVGLAVAAILVSASAIVVAIIHG